MLWVQPTAQRDHANCNQLHSLSLSYSTPLSSSNPLTRRFHAKCLQNNARLIWSCCLLLGGCSRRRLEPTHRSWIVLGELLKASIWGSHKHCLTNLWVPQGQHLCLCLWQIMLQMCTCTVQVGKDSGSFVFESTQPQNSTFLDHFHVTIKSWGIFPETFE